MFFDSFVFLRVPSGQYWRFIHPDFVEERGSDARTTARGNRAWYRVTPEPGPRPIAALGCFAASVFGLLAFVILGRTAGKWLFYPVLIVLLLALIVVLIRILARRR